MADIFEKIERNRGPIGQYSKGVHGYFTFPKLEGELGNKMIFRGKECLVWSLNNYLGPLLSARAWLAATHIRSLTN